MRKMSPKQMRVPASRPLQSLRFFEMGWLLLILTTAVQAQGTGVLSEVEIPFPPGASLPLYHQIGPGAAPGSMHMNVHQLRIGDLDGDGVQDLIFSHELAFLRVYFLERIATAPSVTGQYSADLPAYISLSTSVPIVSSAYTLVLARTFLPT